MIATGSGVLMVATMSLTTGYALGRIRPWNRLDDAAWWRGISQWPKDSRHPTAWAVTWVAMHPIKAYRIVPDAWRILHLPKRERTPITDDENP